MEGIFDVLCGLSAGLNVLNFPMVCEELLRLLECHCPLALQVTLVPNQQYLGVRRA